MIKKWDKFLEGKERVVQLDMFNRYIPEPEVTYENLWTISPDEIEDILIDFEDANFIIEVEHGFINKDGRFGLVISDYADIPSVGITISIGMDTEKDNLTSSFKTAIKRLSSYFKTITFHDNHFNIKFDDIHINKGDIYIQDQQEELDIDGPLFIKCVGQPITIGDQQIIDYYRLSPPNTIKYKDGKAQIEFEVIDLAKILLISNKQSDILIWNEEITANTPTPSTTDILYSLDRETKISLIMYVYYHDVAAFKEFKSPEELKQYVENTLNTKYYNSKILTDLLDKTSLIKQIKSLYKKIEEKDQIKKNYQDLMQDFIKIVEDSLSTKVVDTYLREGQRMLLVNFNLNWFKPDAMRNHRWAGNKVDFEDIESQDFINILSEFGWDSEESLQTEFEQVILSTEEFSKAVNRIIKDSKKI